jgi:hypothetical protein
MLEDIINLLRKGALVACDPTNYEDISDSDALDDYEIEALRNEVLHKWRQPTALYFSIMMCSVGGIVQGLESNRYSLRLAVFLLAVSSIP